MAYIERGLSLKMSFGIDTTTLVLFLVLSCEAVNGNVKDDPVVTTASLYQLNSSFAVEMGVLDKKAFTYATFKDGLLINGWGVLDIVSGNGAGTDLQTMFAAGYLEGALTYKHIYNQYNNIKGVFLDGKSEEVVTELRNFLKEQRSWMNLMVAMHKTDPLWRNVGLILSQYTGLEEGYQGTAPQSMALDDFAFQLLNGAGDLLDLMHAIDKDSRPDFMKMSVEEIKRYIQRTGHCSALIKVLGAYEDVFFSHSSWFVYQSTNRIFKYYNFNIEEYASKRIAFSSYPGFLESLDDFYLMSNGLVMLQTTNNVFNTSLYDLVQVESIPAWIRVRVSNHKSSQSSDWGAWFKQYNSGTYNNQYMILDLNKVKLNETIEDDALWVVEQIPGLVLSDDQTAKLRLGYWPSYNVPYYEEVYNKSGYPAVVEAKGLDMSYQMAPRAKIFRRDAAKVTDMDSMKHIMRYNDFKNDPYSEGNACDTICCRGDLLTSAAKPDGCYDTKVADYNMAKQFQAWVINGPSRGDSLTPFSWVQFKNASHAGLPDIYNFDFIYMKPTL
ncbi:phospholipase B-like 1 [Watersipora subatra]|uniref:phospholipase B-like 1 n=1 Tax=Watersipora subatra TaxID=2589382 RepID=UPI00355B5484